MPKLSLKKDYLDGQILYGESLNRTNEQVEFAFNNLDDLLKQLTTYAQSILPSSHEYTDEQIRAAVEDFALTEAYKQDIAELNESISEIRSVADQSASDVSEAISTANAASQKADTSFNAMNQFVNVTYVNSQEVLSEQTDGKIESFFSDEDPNNWDESDRAQHNGDMWYSKLNNALKRYNSSTNEWIDNLNKTYIDAYENASNYKGAIDGKITTFITEPVPPYDIQDLYNNAGASSLKVCIKSRATGSYDPSDWVLAVKFNDETLLSEFINNEYTDFKSAVDGLTMLYYDYDDPSINWITDAEKDIHVGDLWRDRNTDIIYKYNKSEDEIPVYGWITDNIPSSVFDQIDGKKAIYTLKPIKYDKDDVWIVGAGIDDMPPYINVGDILISNKKNTEFSWDDWNKRDGYVSQETINTALDPINQNLDNVNNDLDLNIPGSKLSQIVQSINAVTTNFQIKGGANLIPNSLQLFESLNNDIFEKTGDWEIRQNQQISENTVSKFMNYCIYPGKIKWVLKTIPGTAYTVSLIYNNDEGDLSTLKLTNGNKITLINETSSKVFTYFSYGFVSNSSSVIIEIETAGDNFGYSDLILNYGAIIEGTNVLPNALKWQPAPGENFGTVIKLSYEGEEITMKNGLFKHIMDNNGDRIILVSTGETVTEFDEGGISTSNGVFSESVTTGIFTELKIDDENQIEY